MESVRPDVAAISGCRGPVANVRALAVSGRRGRLFRVGDRCRRCRRRRESPSGSVVDVVLGGGSVRPAAYVGGVMDDGYVDGMRQRGFVVRRVWMPSSGAESWTVVGLDRVPVGPVESYLAWLANVGRSPNTVRPAHDPARPQSTTPRRSTASTPGGPRTPAAASHRRNRHP